jgi:hypothetical protein
MARLGYLIATLVVSLVLWLLASRLVQTVPPDANETAVIVLIAAGVVFSVDRAMRLLRRPRVER